MVQITANNYGADDCKYYYGANDCKSGANKV
jgi:hypothetical protein